MHFFRKHFFLIGLVLISLFVLAVNIRINLFRYNNFDYGKFDLGNMTQMVWNVTQGNGLMLTDYFGTNLPRWSMSHVDPILYLFAPLFMVFPHALTLVFSQLVLVIFSALIIYKIAELHLKSRFGAFLLGVSWLVFPAIGFLTSQTGFHGVTAAIPFFLLAFYVYEKMYTEDKFTVKGIVLFWVMLIINMMGKEQIPLYIILYGVFILLFRNNAQSFRHGFTTLAGKLGLSLIIVGALWFFTAFFVIIPAYAPQRVAGYNAFLEMIGINEESARDAGLENFFLNRYDEFGDSYIEVALNIFSNPKKTAEVFFGGDKLENLKQTFFPIGYLPIAYPAIFMFALPDMLINYLTTAGGIGTSEISNHRVSMIVPVAFLATIYAIGYFSSLVKKEKYKMSLNVGIPAIVLLLNLYTSHVFNNPVYLWVFQAIQKRVVLPVFAKTDTNVIKQDLKVGDVLRLSELEDKDRECALHVVEAIPDGASVSGPDSLGTHLAQRETYAIFPALYLDADYVIVDVFSRKILTILDLDVEIVRDIVADLIKSENHKLQFGCGNYFVFKKVESYEKGGLLPMQERFEFDQDFYGGVYKDKIYNLPLEFFQGVDLQDFKIKDDHFVRGQAIDMTFTYHRTEGGDEKDTSLEQYIMFTTFVNTKTGELYQFANLPSFALKQPEEWEENRYYFETIDVIIPDYMDPGSYKVFIGMGNKIRTRSMYLGDVVIE